MCAFIRSGESSRSCGAGLLLGAEEEEGGLGVGTSWIMEVGRTKVSYLWFSAKLEMWSQLLTLLLSLSTATSFARP